MLQSPPDSTESSPAQFINQRQLDDIDELSSDKNHSNLGDRMNLDMLTAPHFTTGLITPSRRLSRGFSSSL